MLTIATAMACLFAASYSFALGRPKPHHVPSGIVGGSPSSGLPLALEDASENGLAFKRIAALSIAKREIDEQRIYAALDLTGAHPRLLIASAAGASVARLFEQAAAKVSEGPLGPLKVVDLHPLRSSDPEGLVAFYVTLAATLLGFVTMFQLRGNASGLSLRAWLLDLAGLAVLGGLLLALLTDPVIGALKGPFFELWVALSAEVAVAALFNSTMITMLGRWAMIPTWGMFVALGNASSGGAVAAPLLPGFYAFIGRFLPNGATVEIIRNAVYFTDSQHAEPMIVEAMWLVCCLTALLLASKLLRRTPSDA